MSKSIRHASWVIVAALLMVTGYQLSSDASPAAGPVAVAAAPTAAPAAVTAELPDVLVPQATCSAIKCPPGKICVNTLQCTPDGACFHVGRCVSGP